MTRKPRIDVALLVAHLEEDLPPDQSSRVAALLAEDPAALHEFEQLRRIRDALSAPAGELESLDLASGVGVALRTGWAAPPRSRIRRWLGPAAGALAAGTLLAIGATRFAGGQQPEFRSKSAAGETKPARWAGIQVYRVVEGSAPVRLGSSVSPNDALLFSYTNLGPRPFEYLMIFALGANGRIHWFHPAYERLGTNPRSIPIRGNHTEVALNELVRHDFARGPLSIYALFSRQELRVLDVEAWLAQNRGDESSHTPWGDDVALELVTTRAE